MKKLVLILISFILIFSNINLTVFSKNDKNLNNIENHSNLVVDGKDAPDNAKLKYLFITESSLEVDEDVEFKSQQVGVCIGDGSAYVKSAKLIYNKIGDLQDMEIDVKSIDNEGKVIFEMDFSSNDKGQYVISAIEYTVDQITYHLKLSDAGFSKITFGVGTTVITSPDAYAVDEDKINNPFENNNIKMNISVPDKNGGFKHIENIDKAKKESSLNYNLSMLRSHILANSLVTVVLDPGHGGSDPGSTAIDGTFEKDLNLKIAEFCKNELEQYQNVRVLMTRTDDYYVKLEDRSKIAYDNNANLFVSIHCNYSSNTTAKGAEIYYPNNSNYNHYTHEEGEKAAQNILNQLTALGIKNRGIKNRDADQYFEPYPDDEISDYYSVIRNCRNYGVTGILVEHAFLSNSDDYYSYLYGDDKLEKLGIADATGIANYFNLDKGGDVDLADGTYVISPVSNRENVVDIKDNSLEEGQLAYLNKEYENNNAQKFQVTRSENTYKIKNLNSNMNLSVDNDNIKQAIDNDSDLNQKWKLSKVRDTNCYYLKNSGNSKYMTSKDADLAASDGMFDDTQQFLFIPVSSNKIKDGKYMLCSRNDVEQILDISQGSREDNANCQIYHENQSDAQYFDIVYQDGYYTIKNTNSGKVLDVSGASVNNNANIAQYSFNNSTAQKWSLIDNDDGTFSFISRCNALSIDCAGGSTADNTNIASYFPNGTDAQKFILFDHSNCDTSLENGIYTIASSLDNSYVLDVNGASLNNGENIQIWANNDSLAQRYKFEKIENGYYKIIAQCSEKSLYVENGITGNGTNLKQWDYDSSLASQKWMLEKNNDGSYSIVSRCNGKNLDIAGNLVENGTNVILYEKNNTKAQKFNLKADMPNINLDLTKQYYIDSELNNNCVLDIKGGSLNNGANVQLYKYNGSLAQKFNIVYRGCGYYAFINCGSSKVLDVEGAGITSETNVCQYDFNFSDAQLWQLEDANDDCYYIKSKCNGLYMDVAGASTTDGTNIQVYSHNGTSAQKFKFQEDQKIGYQPIMGATQVSAKQMARFFIRKKGSNSYNNYLNLLGDRKDRAPQNIEDFCQQYIDECTKEGVRAEVAFCQAIKETGYLTYTGDAPPTYFNYCGLGVTGAGIDGPDFEYSWKGMRAHIQHLKAYASKNPLNEECVDPRYNYIKHGCAPNVEDLGGKWAPSLQYGYEINNIISDLLNS